MHQCVVSFLVRESAAFHGSMDALETIGTDEAMYRFAPGHAIRRKMIAPLLDTHAFDKGDAQQMRVLEDVRGKLIDSMTDKHDPLSRSYRGLPAPKYCEFDSRDTLFGQAADIAAGIASTLFQREDIASLVNRFEHVTYNGQRMGESNVAEVLHKLEAI
jgi:hypothetical protein